MARKKKIDDHTLDVLEFGQVRSVLASFASSKLGRDAAEALYPSLDADWIARRTAETTEFKRLLEQGDRVPLAGLRDIRTILENFGKKQTMFEPDQLLEISDTLRAGGHLKAFLGELEPSEFEHLRHMADKLKNFNHIVEEVNRCIDGDGNIRDDASEKLKEIRRQIAHLNRQIQKGFASIVARSDMRRAVENDRLMMRHGRPVIAIKANYRHCLHGTVLDRSNSGATLFIEPDELMESSNELEEAVYEERKEVNRILRELTKTIIQERKDILANVKTLSLIDLTFAKARFSLDYHMAAPELIPEGYLNLQRARHPLLLWWIGQQKDCNVAEIIEDVVPIDVRLGDDFDLLLVTGPNAGGKTVMLKTTGLLVLMVQSGMHIPARADSMVPVYRQVFADIGDEQSIQQSLSTFSAHMQQIVRILNRTSKGTLILLDELGAGTDPAEGAALAVALLDKMLNQGGQIIATSHLGQLKVHAYSTPRAQNASVQFDLETLSPTYRLLLGTPGSSNALAIAGRLGVPKVVVGQAKSLLEKQIDGSTELINQVQMTREAAERNRLKTQQALEDAKHEKQSASEELKRVQEEGQRLKNQADDEIENSMRQIRQVLDDFTVRMQNAPTIWKGPTDELAEKISELSAGTPLAIRQAQFVETLQSGDSVHVISFKRDAIVHRIRRKRRTVVLFLEGKQLEVAFDDICKP